MLKDYISRFFGLGTQTRNSGVQNTNPASYTKTATPVTAETAMQVSSAYACRRLISETIGSMPIYLYKKDKDGGLIKVDDHQLINLFRGKVNRWQTRVEFFETMAAQLCFTGNAYARKIYGLNNNIVSLEPLMSEQMEVSLQKNGEISYRYTQDNKVTEFNENEIWHNKLFGNGIVGLSPLGYAKRTLGISQAAEENVTEIYENGGKPTGLLKIDKVLTPQQRNAIKDNFAEISEKKDQRLFVLEADMAFEKMSLSPSDIELLSSRRFQIEDVARFFGVPSVLINDTSTSTTWGSGITQIVQGWYRLGLKPYLNRMEERLNIDFLTPKERIDHFFKFDFSELTIPDLKDRMEMEGNAVQKGLKSPNEGRSSLGYGAMPGAADGLFMQQQMTPIDKLGAISAPQQQGTQASSKGTTTPDVHVHLPAVNIPEIKMPAPQVFLNPDFTIEPPQVNIKNEMPQPDVHVNVAAPNVEINNTPEVKINMPEREKITKVKYNTDGNIVESVSTEKDIK